MQFKRLELGCILSMQMAALNIAYMNSKAPDHEDAYLMKSLGQFYTAKHAHARTVQLAQACRLQPNL